MSRYSVAFLLFLACSVALAAQDSCPLPPSPFSGDTNIFSPEQEMYLGDLIAEREGRDWKVIQNDELNARLQRVGDGLMKHLPSTDIKYAFTLIDLPVLNSFGIPGGRVYVTRKMVAFLQNDDELAALLAHEIGHIYTHQQAIDFSRLFRDKLGITSIRDRDEVSKDFNALLNQWRLKPDHFNNSRSAREQIVADQLGLYAMARAGYPPETMARFLDRLQETHGKTGSFLSDLFGTTAEDNRRLRELLKNTAAMPAVCIDSSAQTAAGSFAQWQQAVVSFSADHHESPALAASLIRKSVLDPPLQDDFEEIKFSPNGKYLLVQDESGITVLQRDPLSPLFRIPAAEAHPATFSSDSANVVFYTAGLHVERWSIADQKQASAHEILERKSCLQSALSPNGNTFACLQTDLTLKVFDVDSGTILYEKKEFTTINSYALILQILTGEWLKGLHVINLEFDPEGKVMIAASRINTVVLDLTSRKNISFPSALRQSFLYPFTFLSPDRLAIASPFHDGIYEFPSGKLIASVKLGGERLERAAHGNALFIRPLPNYAVGLFSLDRQRLIVRTDKQAIDAYDDVIASEGKDGKLMLGRWNGAGFDVVASANLPRAELTRLRAVAVSADMNWLAFSLQDRGGIYNLDSHQRAALLREFRGAYFVSGPALLSDYPKKGEIPRTIGKLNLQGKTGESLRTLPEDLTASQVGPYLVVRKPRKTGGQVYSDVTLEIQDIVSGKPLFSQHFPGDVPAIFMDPHSNIMVLVGGVKAGTAEHASDNEIESHFSWLSQKQSVYEIQVIDLNTGKKMRDLHVDSGKFSFTVKDIAVNQNYVALSDSENRVQVYSLATGQQIGSVFGGPAYLSASGLMSVIAQNGKIILYDCSGLKTINEFNFPSSPIFAQVSDDGERMLVLTADQTAYLVKTRPQAKTATQTASN